MEQHRRIFGKNLKRLRKEGNLTQEELANITGLTVQYISEVERGIANPKFDTIIRISQGINKHPSELFFCENSFDNTEQRRNKLISTILTVDEQTINGFYKMLLAATRCDTWK